jgi:hypothetical protein
MQAAVMSQDIRMVRGRVCYPCAVMQYTVMIHRMLWWKKVCASLRCHAKLAAVVIHKCWWKKGCISLRCHACRLLS